MCIELSIENKIFLNKVKSKISKKLDKFNESMVRMIEKFDTKYNELGETILNEFNKFKSKNSYSYQQSRGYSNVQSSPSVEVSPDDGYDNIIIQIEAQTNNNSIIPRVQIKDNTEPSIPQQTEMVEKHTIDNKDSFLDDAWDIIHDC